MCLGGTTQPSQKFVTRPDPTLTYVEGNVFDPKDNPPEIDKTPVVDKKKKSSVSHSSDLTINY